MRTMGKRVSREAGRVGQILALLLIAGTLNSIEAQNTTAARWVVGGGGGGVIRTVHRGSFGWNLQVARKLQPARALYVEPGILLQRYGRSSPSDGLCLPDGCPPPLENALSIVGPEVRVAYRDPGSNPVYPVAGVGVYRVSSQDTSGVKFGATLGIGISLRGSGLGPALDFRYLRIFGDSRFHDVFPLALRWSF